MANRKGAHPDPSPSGSTGSQTHSAVSASASSEEPDASSQDESGVARARIGLTIKSKWRIDALLGVGGMAAVYAATHRNGSRAALKILHTEFARDAGIRERFHREGYVANKIDHNGRVAILDDDITDEGEPFLVMELLEGETVQQLWKRKHRKLGVARALRIAEQVLDALGAFHREGIVHRDLKPANIFITREGVVKLLDFGVARLSSADESERTRAGTALGTPSFMAPEQALGLPDGVDGRADLFSVGATLFTLLGGQRLNQGRSDNEAFILAATQSAPSLARDAPEVPAPVIALVDKALAWDPRNRFADAATMRAEVQRLLALFDQDPTPSDLPDEGEIELAEKPPHPGASLATRVHFAPVEEANVHEKGPAFAPSRSSAFVRASPSASPEPRASASSPPSSNGPRAPATLPSARSPTARHAPPRDVAVFESEVDMDEHDQSTRAVEYEEAFLLASESEGVAPAVQAADAPAAALVATAEGTLARTPLVHLLVYLLDQGLTGSVVFQAPEGTKHCIYLQEGVPSKVQTGAMVAPLDRVILDMGLLDESTLRETLLEVSKKRVLHGRHLVLKGLLDRDTVLNVLHVQLVRKTTSLFELPPETAYGFYEGVNLLARYGGPELTPCEPLAVVMAGVRMRAKDPLVDATLARIGGRLLALHIDADVRRFQLLKPEAAVVDLLRARKMTLADLLAAGVAHERVVRLVVYALMISRHLDLGGAGRPPVGVFAPERGQNAPNPAPSKEIKMSETAAVESPAAPVARAQTAFGIGFGQPVKPASPPPAQASNSEAPISLGDADLEVEVVPAAVPPAAPSRPSAEIEARRAAIEARFTSVDADNCYELLGVFEDATPDQIQTAYFGLAKSWHPDRMPAELADLKPHVSKIFAKVNDAYQTLSDAVKRAEYGSKLKDGIAGAEEQAHVARVIDAALEYQKAEALLKKQDLAGAEEFARHAVSVDPDQPEYLTLLVWIQALRKGDPPEGKAARFFEDLIKTLDLILTREPRYERALFYRGMLLKRSGNSDASMRDFRLAAEINPKNIDAVREVRLFEMRNPSLATKPSQPGAKPPEKPGLFSKLFKK